MKPALSGAIPLILAAAPPAGIVTAVQVVPPFAERHVPDRVVAPATVPASRIVPPFAAAAVMPSTAPGPGGEPERGAAHPLPGRAVRREPDHRARLRGVAARDVGAGGEEP